MCGYPAGRSTGPRERIGQMKLTQPIKWHGGKHYLAKRIVDIAKRAPHVHFVESYFGGGSVMLAKDPRGVSEVAGDINGRLTEFWHVLKSELYFPRFQRIVQATPFSEAEWESAHHAKQTGDPVKDAVSFFIDCRMAMSGRMGEKASFAPLSRNRTRRGMNEQASAWISSVDGLPAVHARMRPVVVLNRPGVETIQSQDGKKTLHYVDAPYIHETRATTDEYGENEMTIPQHKNLVSTLAHVEGYAMVSMYHHPIYDVLETGYGWNLHEFDLPNNSAGGKEKRRMVECLWTNF